MEDQIDKILEASIQDAIEKSMKDESVKVLDEEQLQKVIDASVLEYNVERFKEQKFEETLRNQDWISHCRDELVNEIRAQDLEPFPEWDVEVVGDDFDKESKK
jgi:anaerobic ribonucleoside-triphosphate reductase